MSQIDLHKLADVIFGVTQKLLLWYHQTWSGNTSLLRELF